MTNENHDNLTSASDLFESSLNPRRHHGVEMREHAESARPGVDQRLPDESMATRIAAPPDRDRQAVPADATRPDPDPDPAERILGLIETFRSFGTQHSLLFEALCLEQEQLNSVRHQLEADQESWHHERQRQLDQLRQEAAQLQEAWSQLEDAQRAAAIGSAHEPASRESLTAVAMARSPREPHGAADSTNSPGLSGPNAANTSNLLACDTAPARLTPQPWGSESSAVQFQQLKREFRKHASRRH